jgi:hypothetical protein
VEVIFIIDLDCYSVAFFDVSKLAISLSPASRGGPFVVTRVKEIDWAGVPGRFTPVKAIFSGPNTEAQWSKEADSAKINVGELLKLLEPHREREFDGED